MGVSSAVGVRERLRTIQLKELYRDGCLDLVDIDGGTVSFANHETVEGDTESPTVIVRPRSAYLGPSGVAGIGLGLGLGNHVYVVAGSIG